MRRTSSNKRSNSLKPRKSASEKSGGGGDFRRRLFCDFIGKKEGGRVDCSECKKKTGTIGSEWALHLWRNRVLSNYNSQIPLVSSQKGVANHIQVHTHPNRGRGELIPYLEMNDKKKSGMTLRNIE